MLLIRKGVPIEANRLVTEHTAELLEKFWTENDTPTAGRVLYQDYAEVYVKDRDGRAIPLYDLDFWLETPPEIRPEVF